MSTTSAQMQAMAAAARASRSMDAQKNLEQARAGGGVSDLITVAEPTHSPPMIARPPSRSALSPSARSASHRRLSLGGSQVQLGRSLGDGQSVDAALINIHADKSAKEEEEKKASSKRTL